MTVKELREELERLEKEGHAEKPVMVKCLGVLSGGNAAVVGARVGFDWSAGQVVLGADPELSPYQLLVRERKKRRVWRIVNSSRSGSMIVARVDRLPYLAMRFHEVRKASSLGYRDVTDDLVKQHGLESIHEVLEDAPDGRMIIEHDANPASPAAHRWFVVIDEWAH